MPSSSCRAEDYAHLVPAAARPSLHTVPISIAGPGVWPRKRPSPRCVTLICDRLLLDTDVIAEVTPWFVPASSLRLCVSAVNLFPEHDPNHGRAGVRPATME